MRVFLLMISCLFLVSSVHAEDVRPLKSIYFLISRVDESDEFFKTLFDGVRALKTQGRLREFRIVNYEGSEAKLEQKFSDALKQAGGIIMDYVDRNAVENFAKQAYAKNIPLIFAFTRPSPQVLAKYPNVFYITQDDVQSGVSQGLLVSHYLDKHPEADKNHDGKISIVNIAGSGYKAPDETERFNWQLNTIDSYPGSQYKAKEILNYPAQYNSQKAYDLIDRLAQSKQLDKVEMVIAQSDNMAQAAADALKKYGYKIPVAGRGAASSSKAYIRDGRMIGSVRSSPFLVGYYAGMLAYNYKNHLNINSNIPYRVYKSKIELPYEIITKANLDSK